MKKLSFVSRQAIDSLKMLIKAIENEEIFVIESKQERHTEQADFGAVCYETHFGDTTIAMVKFIDNPEKTR